MQSVAPASIARNRPHSRRFRFQIRTLMLLVALAAIVAGYAGPGRRRFAFCWERARICALREGYYLGISALNDRPPAPQDLRKAEFYRREKWRYRWAALRFWEPFELFETELWWR